MLRSMLLACALAVAAPAVAVAQAPTQVTCKDGTTGKAGRGACSHHGGVARNEAAAPAPASRAPAAPASRAPAAPAPVAPPPATPVGPTSRAPASVPRAPAAPAPSRMPPAGQPTARCKDGSMSYSQHHSGSCSHHGGVAQWLQP